MLLIEMRISAEGKILLFTVVNGQQIRSSSIQEFVLSHPDCLSLSIGHSVNILWNKAIERAELYEIYVPVHSGHNLIRVKVRLIVGNTTHETEACETLTEAVMELKELTSPDAEWWIQTCHHCIYSYPAFLGPGWDDRDQLRCYRDTPDEFVQIHQKGQKFVSSDTMYAGNYFVHAFHTCAAWRKPKAIDKDRD